MSCEDREGNHGAELFIPGHIDVNPVALSKKKEVCPVCEKNGSIQMYNLTYFDHWHEKICSLNS